MQDFFEFHIIYPFDIIYGPHHAHFCMIYQIAYSIWRALLLINLGVAFTISPKNYLLREKELNRVKTKTSMIEVALEFLIKISNEINNEIIQARSFVKLYIL